MSRVASGAPTPFGAPAELGRGGGTAAMRRPRVLCVDDEPVVLTMLRRALTGSFEVVTERDPVAALELVRSSGFSVVISDLRMPQMAGSTFLERVKALSPGSARLALTGGLDWQLPPDVALGILTKPCPLGLLQATVAAAAQCHSVSAASVEPTSSRKVACEPAARVAEVTQSGLRPRPRPSRTDAGAQPLRLATLGAALARLELSLLGEVIELGPRATLLGRGMECDIVVRDARIARRHLRFFSSWRGITVQDVGGWGAWLNGQFLSRVSFIHAGDRIGLGPFDVHVRAPNRSRIG